MTKRETKKSKLWTLKVYVEKTTGIGRLGRGWGGGPIPSRRLRPLRLRTLSLSSRRDKAYVPTPEVLQESPTQRDPSLPYIGDETTSHRLGRHTRRLDGDSVSTRDTKDLSSTRGTKQQRYDKKDDRYPVSIAISFTTSTDVTKHRGRRGRREYGERRGHSRHDTKPRKGTGGTRGWNLERS